MKKEKKPGFVKPLNTKKKSGIIIRVHAEFFWRLKEGDFSYANFFVQKIEYDKPERF